MFKTTKLRPNWRILSGEIVAIATTKTIASIEKPKTYNTIHSIK